jgi:hypothetical protein
MAGWLAGWLQVMEIFMVCGNDITEVNDYVNDLNHHYKCESIKVRNNTRDGYHLTIPAALMDKWNHEQKSCNSSFIYSTHIHIATSRS